MSFIKRLLPPYCPSGSSYDSFNQKGDRICKKEGNDIPYKIKKDDNCNKMVDPFGNYQLIEEYKIDDCDAKTNLKEINDLPVGLSETGKRRKRKSKTSKGLSSCPDKQKFYPNSQRTCKKRKMVWHKKSKRCTLKKR